MTTRTRPRFASDGLIRVSGVFRPVRRSRRQTSPEPKLRTQSDRSEAQRIGKCAGWTPVIRRPSPPPIGNRNQFPGPRAPKKKPPSGETGPVMKKGIRVPPGVDRPGFPPGDPQPIDTPLLAGLLPVENEFLPVGQKGGGSERLEPRQGNRLRLSGPDRKQQKPIGGRRRSDQGRPPVWRQREGQTVSQSDRRRT